VSLQGQKTGSLNEFVGFWTYIFRLASPGNAQAAIDRSEGLFFVPPGWDILATASFDAVASNTVTVALYGFQIPRGNIGLP
jgi:hypothetical protein